MSFNYFHFVFGKIQKQQNVILLKSVKQYPLILSCKVFAWSKRSKKLLALFVCTYWVVLVYFIISPAFSTLKNNNNKVPYIDYLYCKRVCVRMCLPLRRESNSVDDTVHRDCTILICSLFWTWLSVEDIYITFFLSFSYFWT